VWLPVRDGTSNSRIALQLPTGPWVACRVGFAQNAAGMMLAAMFNQFSIIQVRGAVDVAPRMTTNRCV
jgi:hypothetical protein